MARCAGTEWDGFECVGIPAGLDGVAMGLVSAPTACSRAPGRMDVFAVGAAGALLHSTWDAAGFSEFESLGGIDLAGASPFASLGSPQEPDGLYPAVRRAVPLTSAPVACGGGTTRLDVFARGPRGDLLHSFWDGKDWNVFRSLGMPRSTSTGARIPFTGISLACAWEKYRVDVLARAADGKLYAASSSGSWDPARSPSNAGLPAD